MAPVNAGQLGKEITTEQGTAAARAIAIDLMGTLQEACGGDLGRVKRVVKLMSLVNSTPGFTDQHIVTNGASELLGEVFGDAGKHARSAFGVAQNPARRLCGNRNDCGSRLTHHQHPGRCLSGGVFPAAYPACSIIGPLRTRPP